METKISISAAISQKNYDFIQKKMDKTEKETGKRNFSRTINEIITDVRENKKPFTFWRHGVKGKPFPLSDPLPEPPPRVEESFHPHPHIQTPPLVSAEDHRATQSTQVALDTIQEAKPSIAPPNASQAIVIKNLLKTRPSNEKTNEKKQSEEIPRVPRHS